MKNRWADKSKLKSDTISKIWLNKKDYKFLDFDFRYIKKGESWRGNKIFKIEVYNFGIKILVLDCKEESHLKDKKERFKFSAEEFNPQTDNDCNSINHIIAVCNEYSQEGYKDMGNCFLLNNQYVFRKKRNYYSFTKIWVKGKIISDNYNKSLSYEFATDEYINYLKHIFEIKRIQRRTIKKRFKGYMDKLLILEELKK